MPRARPHVLPLLVLAGGIAAAFLSAEPPASDAKGYVGAEECGRCHRDIHGTWTDSIHAQTFAEASEATVPPEVWSGKEVEHGPGRTRFQNADGRVLAHTAGPDGKEQAYHLTHRVGRSRVHMYVATLPDGRMQVLPSMREVGRGTWFDYTALFFAGPGGDPNVPPAVHPGDPSFWSGPVRSWDAQCSRCHVSGREALVPPAAGAGPRSRGRALGIDCESCHGPGAAHAEHHDKDLPGLDPLVKPRLLPYRLEVDMCLVCHMETEEIVPGWKPGRGDLVDFVDPSLLDDPDRVDPAGRPLELVYAGVSFWSSRCVEQGGLTCITCHDPHGSEHRSSMRATLPAPRDDGQCVRCHRAIAADLAAHTHHDPQGDGARCVNCHMPMLTVERGHGAVTDHSISIPRPNLKSDRVAQDACAWCHVGGRDAPAGAPPLSETEIRRRHAAWWPKAQTLPPWLDAIAKGRTGAWDAVSRLNALLDDKDAPRFARGTAPVLLSRLGDAARASLVERAKDKDSLVRRRVADALPHVPTPEAWNALVALLDDPSPAVRSHASRSLLNAPGRLVADKPALERLLQVLEQETTWVIDDDLRWERLARARELAADTAGAVVAVERQLLLDPGNRLIASRLADLRESEPGVAEDRLAVYESVLREHYPPNGRGKRIVLLDPYEDHAAMWSVFDSSAKVERWRVQFPEAPDALIQALVAAVGRRETAPAGLRAHLPIERFPLKDFQDLPISPESGSWDAFHRRFPDAAGWVKLSPIVFSPGREQALVATARVLGHLWGGGKAFLLAKRDGRWVVVREAGLWFT